MTKPLNIPRTLVFCTVVAAVALACAGTIAQTSEESAAGLRQQLKEIPEAEHLDFLRGLEAGGRRDAGLCFHLGNTFFNVGNADSAIANYKRAIDADSTFTKAWVNMGLALESVRKNSEARRAFGEAIRINPEDVLAYCHLGFSHFQNGQVAKAIGFYQKALSIDPECAQAHYNLGLAFADAKMFNEALLEWNRVVEIDGDGELGRTAAENVELIQTYMELEDD